MNLRRMVITAVAVLGLSAVALVPAHAQVPPGVIPPIDPANPTIPAVPIVPVPDPLQPFTALGSPVAPTTCTAAFLVPLIGVVAVATVFAESPVPPPIPPGAILPAFSALFALCALTPFPPLRSCDLDRQFQAQAHALPVPAPPPLPEEVASQLPVSVPQADVVSLLPPPVASLISEVIAVQAAFEGTTGVALPIDAGTGMTGYFGCY